MLSGALAPYAAPKRAARERAGQQPADAARVLGRARAGHVVRAERKQVDRPHTSACRSAEQLRASASAPAAPSRARRRASARERGHRERARWSSRSRSSKMASVSRGTGGAAAAPAAPNMRANAASPPHRRAWRFPSARARRLSRPKIRRERENIRARERERRARAAAMPADMFTAVTPTSLTHAPCANGAFIAACGSSAPSPR